MPTANWSVCRPSPAARYEVRRFGTGRSVCCGWAWDTSGMGQVDRQLAGTGPKPSPSAVDVLAFLMNRQETTRREIAMHTGLSAAAVTKALRPMVQAGLVRETSLGRIAGNGAGRPTQQVRIVAERITVVGIKVTANRLIAVVTNLAGAIIEDLEVTLQSAPRRVDVGIVVDAIRSVVGDLSARYRIDEVGIAISGDVDTERGIVVLSPLLGWHDVDLVEQLSKVVEPPLIIDNDIRALTIAERSFGDAMGVDNFALVTIGEGIGCGLVIGGQVLRGAFGVAGELAHMIIATPEGGSVAGRQGRVFPQVEPLISRSAVMARARRLVPGRRPKGFADLVTGSRAGIDAYQRLLDEVGAELGAAIANVVNLVGPARLVISSEGFDLGQAFGSVVDQTIRDNAFGQAGQVEIVHREIPFSEWARGAAVLALNDRVSAGRLGTATGR